jgi:DNA-binding NtrC family response regulator
MRNSHVLETHAASQAPARPRSLLVVSPMDDDHYSVKALIRGPQWTIFTARDLPSAVALLKQHQIGVVLCETTLAMGTWTDLLDCLNALLDGPSLIVTSRLADDHLWAKALNLGAWDVLAKPFDRRELLRSVELAWLHWHYTTEQEASPKGFAATG